ncbi:MAG: sigma-54 dependent transcriptional regulator [Candidatus Sumerlaeia bacterium]
MKPPQILIADDEPNVLAALRLLLKGQGYRVESASSAQAVLESLTAGSYDAVVMDLNYTRGTTTGAEGLDLVARIRDLDETLPVVVMTAWASIELAVEAMRRGARDFIPKPWKNERLLTILRTQIELCRALREGKRLSVTNRLIGEDQQSRMIVASPAMRPVLELIERAAPSEANIFIFGENGTGKEVIARAVHAASARADKPLIAVNMGGLSETLFESELFGHVKGAFTGGSGDRIGRFELADGGTLFLDELANVSPAMQAKLLRVLESGEFEPVGSSRTRRASVRLISATNADLSKEVAEGRFRQDLFFRLNTIAIEVPPLRDRREDIPLLADHFLGIYAGHYRKPLVGFTRDAIDLLLRHPWPGNVRELKHSIERAVLMAKGEQIGQSDLGLALNVSDADRSLDEMSLEEVERVLIRKALGRNGGNVSLAARALGLSRSALYRRLEKHGL